MCSLTIERPDAGRMICHSGIDRADCGVLCSSCSLRDAGHRRDLLLSSYHVSVFRMDRAEGEVRTVIQYICATSRSFELLYAYIYIYIYIYMYIYIYTHTHILYIYTCIYIYTHTHTHTQT